MDVRKLLLVSLVAWAGFSQAQVASKPSPPAGPRNVVSGIVPTTPAAITSGPGRIWVLRVTNVSASSTTLTLVDTSTDCAGGPCTWENALPIPPGNYTEDFKGLPVGGSLVISAGAAGALNLKMEVSQ